MRVCVLCVLYVCACMCVCECVRACIHSTQLCVGMRAQLVPPILCGRARCTSEVIEILCLFVSPVVHSVYTHTVHTYLRRNGKQRREREEGLSCWQLILHRYLC